MKYFYYNNLTYIHLFHGILFFSTFFGRPGYLVEMEDVGQLIGFQLYFYQEPLKYLVGSVEGHDNILLWNHTCF